AAASGIDQDLAQRIVHRFQQYRRTPSVPPAGPNASAAELNEIVRRTTRLKKLHEEFERTDDGWNEDAARDRRRLRKDRETALLDVRVLLARLGEVDVISKIDKLSFAAKIDALESYVREREKKR